jgi:hypothetical protein
MSFNVSFKYLKVTLFVLHPKLILRQIVCRTWKTCKRSLKQKNAGQPPGRRGSERKAGRQAEGVGVEKKELSAKAEGASHTQRIVDVPKQQPGFLQHFRVDRIWR